MQRLFVLAVVFFSFNVMGDQPEHPVAMSWNGFRGEVYSSGDLLMGGQPLSAQAMSKLKDEGVLTIVNLRTAKEMADQESTPIDEAHIASQLGIEYVQLPSGGDDGFNQQTVSDFAKVYNNAKGKVLLHCNSGRRATHLWVAYLIDHAGVDVNKAISLGKAANFGATPLEGYLQGQLIYQNSAQ